MNETPFPEGDQPQPESDYSSASTPYDFETPIPPDSTLPPEPPADAPAPGAVTPGAATPPPPFQPSAPAGFAATPGFSPVQAAPVVARRRRGPIWPWVVGAIVAVALICGLGFVAGMAINAAHGGAVAATPSAYPSERGKGHGPGQGPGSPHRGEVVTVTGVSGNTITATGPDGASLTIVVTSQTVITGMNHQPAQVSDIKSGERIGVVPVQVSGTSVTAGRIAILPYTMSGTVTGVTATTITVVRGQQSETITVTNATTFKGQVTSLSQIMKGMLVIAEGPALTNGALDATVVMVGTPPVTGKVTAVTATSVTVTNLQGAQQTIIINASTQITTLGAPGATPAAASASIQPGDFIVARGTLDASGAFTAQKIMVLPAQGPEGWGGPPNGSWPGGGPNQPPQAN